MAYDPKLLKVVKAALEHERDLAKRLEPVQTTKEKLLVEKARPHDGISN
jgi:hypothetical protein